VTIIQLFPQLGVITRYAQVEQTQQTMSTNTRVCIQAAGNDCQNELNIQEKLKSYNF